ncbi:glycoside hydrolase family 2 [Grosmannia clavigera kw1407]|uniref:Glycoside hydrolase family 2 n=1 Tax=Grosmannia clavigera (strain kw1407 / UAMH 11150) TaxID=655863 RepID=F0XL86_GROCL|nr:glycoside hydrolase family 2 [Grosmannia clavigera kw1407]EFX01549.1 glycoside hydrolase family 2 [Grosmannia clavigera kw1407]
MILPKRQTATGLAVLNWMNLAMPAASMATSTARSALVSTPGDVAAIPTWDIQSTAKITIDPATLSKPGTMQGSEGMSSWYHIPVSRCTIMGCLLEAGIYDDTHLFFSDHMAAIDQRQFQVPWFYRSEFFLNANATPNTHYLLETNGVTSSADIFINGQQIADRFEQVGAYGGYVYEVTDAVGEDNAIVVRAYPTDYDRDFGLGFVDWNPYPPDNGTGVWRNVTMRQTGSVAIESTSVMTAFSGSSQEVDEPVSGTVTIQVTVRNLENTSPVHLDMAAIVKRDNGTEEQVVKLVLPAPSTSPIKLMAGHAIQLTLETEISAPAVWWPRQWGNQPLYQAHLRVFAGGHLSDTVSMTFGFRQVTAEVGSSGDILFEINRRPFQVLGAGLNPDLFLRWDEARFTNEALYALDMGLNTLRLEGKLEQPELYAVADRLGIMVLAGWECCDKWETWSHNNNLEQPVIAWTDADYATANASMRHEAAMMQAHPSMLCFMIGSDYWPDDRATALYMARLADAGWQAPVVSSGARIGFPLALGPAGMKMTGPYDWVPPRYWYDVVPPDDHIRHGAAFGFGSELSSGAGTPEVSSLCRFLSEADLDDLWRAPDKGLYHMSTASSSFHNRSIYNTALWKRYGPLTSLENYVMLAQMADYEATRSEFEAFEAYWTPDKDDSRPATGMVYWMLNAAWPALHWALFDYYLLPGGAYFGVKAAASRLEHVVYDYVRHSAVIVNRSIDRGGLRSVHSELLDGSGQILATKTTRHGALNSIPNTSQVALDNILGVAELTEVVLLKLTLTDEDTSKNLSRSVYWLGPGDDALDWDASTWFCTPTITYTSFSGLDTLAPANVIVELQKATDDGCHNITLENQSDVPAVFVHLRLVDAADADVTPVYWSDNYVTLWPREILQLALEEMPQSGAVSQGAAIHMSGMNVAAAVVSLCTFGMTLAKSNVEEMALF